MRDCIDVSDYKFLLFIKTVNIHFLHDLLVCDLSFTIIIDRIWIEFVAFIS